MRDQLNNVWRQTGIKPKELDELLEIPQSCEHVWKWFIDLNSGRTSNGFGPNPLTYSDIYSYFTLYNMYPDEWELELIKVLDKTALDAISKQIDKETKSK